MSRYLTAILAAFTVAPAPANAGTSPAVWGSCRSTTSPGARRAMSSSAWGRRVSTARLQVVAEEGGWQGARSPAGRVLDVGGPDEDDRLPAAVQVPVESQMPEGRDLAGDCVREAAAAGAVLPEVGASYKPAALPAGYLW